MMTTPTSEDPMNTPALEHLMGAYFHQDFHDLYGGVWETLEAFAADSPNEACRLPGEIAGLLGSHPSEDAIDDYLDRLGCEYQPRPEDGGYRGWLEEIARRAEVV
jgi:hypothetical protein